MTGVLKGLACITGVVQERIGALGRRSTSRNTGRLFPRQGRHVGDCDRRERMRSDAASGGSASSAEVKPNLAAQEVDLANQGFGNVQVGCCSGGEQVKRAVWIRDEGWLSRILT